MIASLFAFREINSSPDFLPNFNIDVWNFSAGVLCPDMIALEKDIIPQKDRLGTAIIANIGSTSTMPIITYLRQRNITTPVVGAITSDSRLSSQAVFPNFIRLCISDDYVNVVIVQTIKHLGWGKCSLLVTDRSDGLKIRNIFQQLLPRSGIEIVNDPAYQVISSTVSGLDEARANFTAAFQHIIDTKCRVVIALTIMSWDLVPLIFYELGMRKGDLLIVGRGWIVPLSFEKLTKEQVVSTSEIMQGSILLSSEVFVGTVGKAFKQRFYEATHIPPLSYACQYYDAAYTIAHALEWMLRSGKDFLNSTQMMKALHGTRFKGCTGLVYFEADTNDRQTMRYTLSTLLYNESAGLYLRPMGVYDPAGMVLLAIDKDFQWSESGGKIPSNMRESSYGCPFEDRLNQLFAHGTYLLIGVGLGFSLYAGILSLIVWKHCNSPLEELHARREIESDDILVELGVLIDLIQSIALSSGLFFTSQLHNIFTLSIGNFAELRDMKNGGFFQLWVTVECMNCGFIVGVAMLQWCLYCRGMQGLSNILLDLWVYLFANWLFVPNVLTLLSVFDCTNGVANIGETVRFSSSYLAADCSQTCWHSSHILMAALSASTLLAYIAIVVVYRPS